MDTETDKLSLTTSELTAMLKLEYDRGFADAKRTIRTNGVSRVQRVKHAVETLDVSLILMAEELFRKGHTLRDVCNALSIQGTSADIYSTFKASGYDLKRTLYSCFASGRRDIKEFSPVELAEIQTLLTSTQETVLNIAAQYGGTVERLQTRLKKTGYYLGYTLVKRNESE